MAAKPPKLLTVGYSLKIQGVYTASLREGCQRTVGYPLKNQGINT